MEQEPRYFWRRSSATVIDSLLISLIVFVLYLPLTALFPNQFIIQSSPLASTSCTSLSSPPESFLQALPNNFYPQDTKVRYQQCEITSFLVGKKYLGTTSATILMQIDPIKISTRSYSKPTDKNGNPIPGQDYQNILGLIVSILIPSVFLTFWSGRTIGKMVFGIRVKADNQSSLGLFIKRESLKYFPILVVALIAIPVWISDTTFEADLISQSSGVVYLAMISILLISAIWYILPLMRWDGQMPYDRLTGLKVIKN